MILGFVQMFDVSEESKWTRGTIDQKILYSTAKLRFRNRSTNSTIVTPNSGTSPSASIVSGKSSSIRIV